MAKVEEKKETITIAVYKANLHCPKCAHDIKKPLMRTPGTHLSLKIATFLIILRLVFITI